MVGEEVTAEGDAQGAPMSTMRIETLDNGLVVLLQEQHTVPVATFWVWYRVGSRNEIPGLTGISRWVEHMLFKGTPTHPKGMLTRHIDRLGGRWNAFTWKDYTAYHEVLPAVLPSKHRRGGRGRAVGREFDGGTDQAGIRRRSGGPDPPEGPGAGAAAGGRTPGRAAPVWWGDRIPARRLSRARRVAPGSGGAAGRRRPALWFQEFRAV